MKIMAKKCPACGSKNIHSIWDGTAVACNNCGNVYDPKWKAL